MGMMSKILSPLAPTGMVDKIQVSGKTAPAGPGGKSDETLRRIRRDYLHSLGIRSAKGATVLVRPNPMAEAVPEGEVVDEDSSGTSEPGSGSSEQGSVVSFDGKNILPLDSTSPDAFRVNFLRKLSYSKVWVPPTQRPPKHQTVIIFDWDDTLLCTSYLSAFQNRPLPAHTESTLAEIGRAARRLLELAQQWGQTFIITNAMAGWVEYSAARWVPEMLPALAKVHTISARSKYESCFPDIHQWKIQAFLEVRRKLDSQVVTNLLSVGDSDFEMEAVHVMGSEFAEALVKTVKFRECPVPDDLLKELMLVGAKFERIVEAGRHLKVCLDRRQQPVNEG
mmetsp:Transcript_57102/g.169878  ORF Transcript_57102/g.169878 Transcript_57102/m.169878 type:complete len:337 (-) Transcript_57102:155-1165(-)